MKPRWWREQSSGVTKQPVMANAIQSPIPTSTQLVSGETRVGTGILEPFEERV
jgi:hypothetical protein